MIEKFVQPLRSLSSTDFSLAVDTLLTSSFFNKLEDLYVKPAHRTLGVGKAFFGQLGKIAQDKVLIPQLNRPSEGKALSLLPELWKT